MTYIKETSTFIGVWLSDDPYNAQHERIEAIPGYVRTVWDEDRPYFIFETELLTETGVSLFVQRALEGNPISSKIEPDDGGIIWRNV